jgi:hypothetical protein
VQGVVDPPTQVLVLVLDGAADHQNVLNAAEKGLDQVLPKGMHLDVWLMSGHDDLLSRFAAHGRTSTVLRRQGKNRGGNFLGDRQPNETLFGTC